MNNNDPEMGDIKIYLDKMLQIIEDEKFYEINKNRQSLADLYKIKFKPKNSSATSLFNSKNIQYNPYSGENINFRGMYKRPQHAVKMPVKLKHSVSMKENLNIQNNKSNISSPFQSEKMIPQLKKNK
jgi:hypothetical protein